MVFPDVWSNSDLPLETSTATSWPVVGGGGGGWVGGGNCLAPINSKN